MCNFSVQYHYIVKQTDDENWDINSSLESWSNDKFSLLTLQRKYMVLGNENQFEDRESEIVVKWLRC